MPESAGTNNGCWTCRARRKKCDEQPKCCSTCISLRLNCYGYGSRPEWMDGGRKEKAKALSFKAVVKTTLAIRRQRKQSLQLIPTLKEQASQPDYDVSTRRNSFPVDSHQYLQIMSPPSPPSLSPNPYLCEETKQKESLDTVPVGKKPHCAPLLKRTYKGPKESQQDRPNPWKSSFPIGLINAEATLLTPPDVDLYVPAPHLDQIHSPALDLQQEENLISFMESWRVPETQIYEPQLVLECVEPPQPSPLVDGVLETSLHLALEEVHNLRYYLETVFPGTFIFLNADNRQIISNAVFSVATRSPACLASVLGQSIYFQQSQLESFGLNSDTEYEKASLKYEKTVLQEIEKFTSHFNPETLQDCNSSKLEDMQMTAASSLLSHVLRGSSDWQSTLHAAINLPYVQPSTLATFSASVFFLSITVSIEILASTTTSIVPQVAIQYQRLLSSDFDSTFTFPQILGIHPWVLEDMMQISLLRLWKLEQSHFNALSATELVKRALIIGIHIEDKRGEIFNHISSDWILTPSSSGKSPWILTNIFASALLVYLHTVVSGPKPNVPEVQAAVAQTEAAIKLLSDPELLAALTWPVCIAGSMAGVGEREFWRKLAVGSRTEVRRGVRGKNVIRAFEIVEECWRLRDAVESEDALESGVDWTNAMEELGMEILLF